MTRNVIDNAILLSAMTGEDPTDSKTKDNPKGVKYWEDFSYASLRTIRLGANKQMMEDSIYNLTIEKLKSWGTTIIEFEPGQMKFEGFTTVLNADMKVDLPHYFSQHGGSSIPVKTTKDVMEYNLKDTTLYAPYGQTNLEAVVGETISKEDLQALIDRFEKDARKYFDTPMNEHNLDAILSINNWNAGHAAMAKYPCLTVPMGYKDSGEPISLTFIAKTFQEDKLLQMGYAFEKATKVRKQPTGY